MSAVKDPDRIVRTGYPHPFIQPNDVISIEKVRREAFYDWMTEDIHAEFINGEIIIHSPAKKRHTDAFTKLFALMSTWVDFRQLGFVGAETVMVSLTRNDYLPDICFYGDEKADQLHPDQMKYPAPDMVVEILSPSTEHRDRGVKFEDYARHGVAEYWIVDTVAETIEQYENQDGAYYFIGKLSGDETVKSVVITGFEIPVAAVLDTQTKNKTLVRMLNV